MNSNHTRSLALAGLLLAATAAPAAASVVAPGNAPASIRLELHGNALTLHLASTHPDATVRWDVTPWVGSVLYVPGATSDVCVDLPEGYASGQVYVSERWWDSFGHQQAGDSGVWWIGVDGPGPSCSVATSVASNPQHPDLLPPPPSRDEVIAALLPPLPVVETPEAPAAPATPEVDAPPVQETPVLGAPTILPPGPLPVEVVEAPTAGYMGSAVVA